METFQFKFKLFKQCVDFKKIMTSGMVLSKSLSTKEDLDNFGVMKEGCFICMIISKDYDLMEIYSVNLVLLKHFREKVSMTNNF